MKIKAGVDRPRRLRKSEDSDSEGDNIFLDIFGVFGFGVLNLFPNLAILMQMTRVDTVIARRGIMPHITKSQIVVR